MTRGALRMVWGLALVLLALCGWQARTLTDPYRAGAPTGAVDDRREHHFRSLSAAQTQRLFERLLLDATQATDPAQRGRALARIAALQNERGLSEAAAAAANEARHTAPNDPEVTRLLSTPLDLDAMRVSP